MLCQMEGFKCNGMSLTLVLSNTYFISLKINREDGYSSHNSCWKVFLSHILITCIYTVKKS